jgi:hydroxyethylthiazole kinase
MQPWIDLQQVRGRAPLIHNITNYVVMNSTANALLAVGASPVMAHAIEELDEMVAIASALVINIGTLSEHWVESMSRAGRAARRRGIPIVLDPVGSGATRMRTTVALRLIDEAQPTVIRGNA